VVDAEEEIPTLDAHRAQPSHRDSRRAGRQGSQVVHRKPRRKADWQGLPMAERRQWRRGMFIDHPDVQQVVVDALEYVDYCVEAGESTAMHVIAESGAGKTTLVVELSRILTERFWRDHPEKTIVPALRLQPPTPCTPAELCYAILEALGDPHARRRKHIEQTGNLTKLTARMMTECEVRIVLFDNFQDIPSARRARGIEQVGVRLRDLIDASCCVWMFLGTHDSREVINAKSQLLKRVPYSKEIRYFTIEGNGARFFLRLLERLDEWLPLAESSWVLLKELSGRIFIATEGVLDRLTKLLDNACRCAVRAGREVLVKQDLHAAFAKTFGSDHPNPFHDAFVVRRLDGPNEPYEKFGASAHARTRAARYGAGQ